MKVNGLIWDDWNKDHILKHGVTTEDVEEVCHGRNKVKKSYRRRLQISGVTKDGKTLTVILSPESRDHKIYGDKRYYPITAFEEVDL